MSNDDSHSTLAPEPSDRKALFSAIGWIGVMFIFAVIVLIAYVDRRRDLPQSFFDEERLAIRQRVESSQTERIQSYGWENEAEGVVRIPVSRAMELVVRDLQPSPSLEPEVAN